MADISDGSYVCLCTPNYTGINCATPRNSTTVVTTSVNPCASNPCLNNGFCNLLGSTYTCICLQGFIQPNCAAP